MRFIDKYELAQMVKIWDQAALDDNQADLHAKDNKGRRVKQLASHLNQVFLLRTEFL